jgi:AcrR family transcriptional regulator
VPRRGKEEKAERMIEATLAVLSKKGYENTTINDVADAAKVSRGLLHYYFKDKEDMVSKALAFGFEPMWGLFCRQPVKRPDAGRVGGRHD